MKKAELKNMMHFVIERKTLRKKQLLCIEEVDGRATKKRKLRL